MKQTPRLTLTENEPLDIELQERIYLSYNEDPQYFSQEDEEKLSAEAVRQYIVGGWVRWLSFIDETFQDSDLTPVLFRLVARPYSEDFRDVMEPKDHMVVAWADKDSYKFCTHDVELNKFDICNEISIFGAPRENSWHFVLVIYDYETKMFYMKVKINDVWLSSEVSVTQTPFNGYIGLYLGSDVVKEGRTGFNGDIDAWNMLYGTNFLDGYLEGNPDDIITGIFRDYNDVPYRERKFDVSCNVLVQTPKDFSSFTFINTLMDATDYGFAFWVKVNMLSEDESNTDPQQILTFAFENRSEINTFGKAIAQIYLINSTIYAEVVYEENNTIVSVPQAIIEEGANNWNFIQIHFSKTNNKIEAWVINDEGSKSFQWNTTSILVPKNAYLTLGTNNVVGRTGGDFKAKNVVVYAGNYVLYDESIETNFLERQNGKVEKMKIIKNLRKKFGLGF